MDQEGEGRLPRKEITQHYSSCMFEESFHAAQKKINYIQTVKDEETEGRHRQISKENERYAGESTRNSQYLKSCIEKRNIYTNCYKERSTEKKMDRQARRTKTVLKNERETFNIYNPAQRREIYVYKLLQRKMQRNNTDR